MAPRRNLRNHPRRAWVLLLVSMTTLIVAFGQVGAQASSPGMFNGSIAYHVYGCNFGGCASVTDTIDPVNGAYSRLASVGGYSDWSPDGTRLLIVSESIYVVNADGSGLTKLPVDPYASSASWSPDGTRIAYTFRPLGFDARTGLYVMNADGSGQTRILLLPAPYDVTKVRWSPAGDRLAFELRGDGRSFVGTVKPDGSDFRTPAGITFQSFNPDWSPDGSRIVFTSLPDGRVELYVMNVDGTGRTRLTHNFEWTNPGGASQSWSPSWSPDGRKIAYAQHHEINDANWHLRVFDLDAGENETFDEEILPYDSSFGPNPPPALDWQPIAAPVPCARRALTQTIARVATPIDSPVFQTVGNAVTELDGALATVIGSSPAVPIVTRTYSQQAPLARTVMEPPTRMLC